MNKKEYLSVLEKNLKTNRVLDIEDILEEYRQHFDFKIADGYTEEGIAARLEDPTELAGQFAVNTVKRKGNRVATATGLAFADVFVFMFFIMLFAWVAVLGAFALCSAFLGVSLVGNFDVAGLIPPMPYTGGLIIGIGCLALGIVAACGTIYCWLYSVQLVRAYFRWHRNTMIAACSGRVHPSLPKHPYLVPKFRRRLRSVTLIVLTVCGLCLIAGMLFMFAYTDFKPFWHELNWFQ